MKIRRALFATAALAALSGQVQAEARQGYFGVSLGQATVDDFCGGGESSCDDSVVSGRIYGGTQLNGFASAEFGYRYVSELEASGYANGVSAHLAVRGHFADATLQLGLPESGPFQVFTKAGLMFWLLDYDVTGSYQGYYVSMSDNDSGVGFRTGLGARYDITENISLRADWDYLVNVGDDLGETDINVFSAGPEFRF